MTPIASAKACPYFRDGHCTLVTYAADHKAAVTCSLQAGNFEDCPIYIDAPRS